jgi:acetyl-CoA carboxylase biotin carboxyl carrier protein
MPQSKFPIDPEAIRTLAGLLDETGLSEIEVEDGGRKLRVARGGAGLIAAAPALHALQAPAAAPVEGAEARAAEISHPGAVKSPMVGTAYLAPEPGAPTYVKVGDLVGEGDTLLIIEAMKVMNPIRAQKGGRVASVLVENGSPVEYGQVLMVID